MGLIRSGNTDILVEDDKSLEEYLWPILKEMVKTAIENKQNLIVEGSYIPFSWQDDFSSEYLSFIRFIPIVFSEMYIRDHFEVIERYASVIEDRLDDSYITKSYLIKENNYYEEGFVLHKHEYIKVVSNYKKDVFCSEIIKSLL